MTQPALASDVEALLTTLGDGDDALVALVDLGVLVASADGVIDDDELASLADLLHGAVGMRLDPSIVKHFVREARARLAADGRDARTQAVGAALAAKGAGAGGLAVAVAIARASQGVSADETAAIVAIAKAAELPETAALDAIGARS